MNIIKRGMASLYFVHTVHLLKQTVEDLIMTRFTFVY